MKKTIIFALLALLGMTQAVALEYEYVPFVREGVKWVCGYYLKSRDEIGVYTLEFKGDTIINDISYKVMHKYSGTAINYENDTVPVCMREENKVVYAIVPDGKCFPEIPIGNYYKPDDSRAVHEGREFILYDFYDPVAYWTEFANSWGGEYEHCSTDTIRVGTHRVKKYVGYIPLLCGPFELIEGIGMISTNTYPLAFFMPAWASIAVPYDSFGYYYVIENGEIIYNFFYPDGGIDEVADRQTLKADCNYYDLMGRAVGKDVPTTPGIYIHQGKKIVIR